MASSVPSARTTGLVAACLVAALAAPRLIGRGAPEGPELDQSAGAKLARVAVDRTFDRLEAAVIPSDLEVRRGSFEDAWEVERSGYRVRTTRSPLFGTWCADVLAAAQADVRFLIGAEDVELSATPRVPLSAVPNEPPEVTAMDRECHCRRSSRYADMQTAVGLTYPPVTIRPPARHPSGGCHRDQDTIGGHARCTSSTWRPRYARHPPRRPAPGSLELPSPSTGPRSPRDLPRALRG